MVLTADEDITITACKGKVVISAKQDILLTSGGGYIKLSGGNIDILPRHGEREGTEHALSGKWHDHAIQAVPKTGAA